MMNLKSTDSIVTVYAVMASGPGWANTPLFVIYRDGNGLLHEDAIQPEDQTKEIRTIFEIAAIVHSKLLLATKRAIGGTR